MADRAKAYKEAGVDIDAGNRLVKNIGKIVSSTFTKGVLTDIGGFGGLFKLDLRDMEEPVLVSGTDGVGTKLKLAFDFDKHDTIGVDLVAMSVNDILVQGAKPLFFLDYFATGKLDTDVAEKVIASIAAGCKQSECALLGGETAEMPGFYADGEYDISGFCVGIVDNNKIVDGSSIAFGDKVIGLASSGLHSNGYSLVRKIVEEQGLKADDTFPGTSKKASTVLLEPTKIYVREVGYLLRDFEIKGMVHITGGGFFDNIPRVLPRGVCTEINFGSWDIPPVFNWLAEAGNLTWPEMLQIFNCGLGYVIIVAPEIAEEVLDRLEGMGQDAWLIGDVKRAAKGGEQVEINYPE